MQIHVLPLEWPNLRYASTMPDVWPVLARADLTQARLVLSHLDFLIYDWTHQEIWLNDFALERMEHAGTGDLLQGHLGRAFVVTLESERLYGGLLYAEGAPPAIRFPVIHAIGPRGRVLRIRPGLCCGWIPDEPSLADQCCAIADPRLGDWLRAHGVLSEHPPAARPPDPWHNHF